MTYYKSAKQIEPDLKRAYDDGLDDAWECAKKLMLSMADGGLNRDELQDIFGNTDYYNLLKTLTASEAMAKIKEYNEGIKVGDEVIDNNTNYFGVVTRVKDLMVYVTYRDGSSGIHYMSEFTKTGRHFPQIEEVLNQMQEAQDRK